MNTSSCRVVEFSSRSDEQAMRVCSKGNDIKSFVRLWIAAGRWRWFQMCPVLLCRRPSLFPKLINVFVLPSNKRHLNVLGAKYFTCFRVYSENPDK